MISLSNIKMTENNRHWHGQVLTRSLVSCPRREVYDTVLLTLALSRITNTTYSSSGYPASFPITYDGLYTALPFDIMSRRQASKFVVLSTGNLCTVAMAGMGYCIESMIEEA